MKSLAFHRRTGWAPGCRSGGFTLVELLVSVGLIATLIAMLLPAVRGARRQAIGVQCQTQLRELYAAQIQYAGNHRGRFTPIVQGGDRWEQLLGPYVRKSGQLPRELMHCPASPKRDESSLGAQLYSSFGLNPALQMNNWQFRRDARMDASRIILMADKADHAADDFLTTADGWFVLGDGVLGQWWRYTAHSPRSSLRHGGSGAAARANALMADGHVTTLDARQLQRDSGHWYWGSIEGMPAREVAAACCP